MCHCQCNRILRQAGVLEKELTYPIWIPLVRVLWPSDRQEIFDEPFILLKQTPGGAVGQACKIVFVLVEVDYFFRIHSGAAQGN